VALLSRAKLLLSNDSGSMHIMAALQRPQLAVFGSTSPTWTRPLNPHARFLYRAEPCSPCFDRTCQFSHTNCLISIQPADVVQELADMLE
ncbi:MAG: glycosyltransferase family 9 protein, partial [bacterium]